MIKLEIEFTIERKTKLEIERTIELVIKIKIELNIILKMDFHSFSSRAITPIRMPSATPLVVQVDPYIFFDVCIDDFIVFDVQVHLSIVFVARSIAL